MPGCGKSSHEILKYPWRALPSLGPTPESEGGSGVHLEPAKSLKVWIASGPRKGRRATGTTTVLFAVTG